MLKTMINTTVSVVICALSAFGSSSTDNAKKITTTIYLDGEITRVYFNDGDTFKILEEEPDIKLKRNKELKQARVRVTGINTLETYGPVHQWLGNTPEYLLTIAHSATEIAQNGTWNCITSGQKDVYGRLLAKCDDLSRALISAGLAHVYSVDSKPASAKYISLQNKAQEDKVGMWKNGTPPLIITSLHSANEGGSEPYNRLISTANGTSTKMVHHDNYGTCEKVCLDEDNSCMVYVPFEKRYGASRPECLRSH